MKETFSSALGPRRFFLVTLETLLFANEALCILLFLGAAILAPGHWKLGLGWAVAPSAGLLALNTWALGWSAKTRHFVGLFASWPREKRPQGLAQSEEHSLLAARDAFDQGQFAKVPGLLGRVPGERLLPGHWLGLGRALALSGRIEEALPALERGGEKSKVLAYFHPRKRFGMELGPYFGETMPGRLERIPWLALPVLALLIGSGGLATAVGAALPRLAPAASFDTSAFYTETRGRLTVFYHDADFRDQASALAEAALDHDLAFLGMPGDSFAPGSVKLYLCDSEAEYRRRAPTHPSWEAAAADPQATAIYIYRFPDKEKVFFEVVMAHEIGHLCYYRMTGSNPDDWLNEGLADYLGYDFGLERAGIPRQAWLQDNYFRSLRVRALPFDSFFKTDPHQLPDAEVATFYTQGFSVVYLLIEDYGRGPFLKFLRECAAHKGIDAALAAAFPTIPNIGALASVWSLFYPREAPAPTAAPA